MTIKELLDAEIGTVFTDFDVTIKTCKKMWQQEDEKWVQQIVISDNTGDALADVMLYKYAPLIRNTTLHVIYLVVQPGVPEAGDKTDKKLFIKRSVTPTDIGEPELGSISDVTDQIVRSKIRCHLVSADRQAKFQVYKDKIDEYKAEINYWVEFVLTGN